MILSDVIFSFYKSQNYSFFHLTFLFVKSSKKELQYSSFFTILFNMMLSIAGSLAHCL